MPSRFVWPDRATLWRLYVVERHTLLELAALLGCSTTTVSRRLRQFGIPARSRGPIPLREASDFVWSPPIAYAVGLIATDGNLSGDGRHISVVSKDLDQLEALRRCLGLRVSIREFKSRTGRLARRVQWSDRAFYKVLLSIGLTPNKSLTLGRLAIPDVYFPDFFRGCIDGDGSVLVYIDRYHTAKNERYVYTRLYVSLTSASRTFVDWIQLTVQRLTSLHGVIEIQHKAGRRPI
jgi:AraC-like DNA-binding protein